MAFTPYTLEKETKVFHTLTSGNKLELTLAPGTVVRRQITETDSERVLTIRYTHDGFVWERVQRKSKEGSTPTTNGNAHSALPIPPTTPVCNCQKISDHSRRHGAHHAMTCPMFRADPVEPSTPVLPSGEPISQQTQAAMNHTAKDAAAAVGVLASRSTYAEDTQEKRVRALDRAATMLRGKVFQVNYYIPTTLNDEVDNPSRIFRRHGFRLDGSNWVFPQHGLEHKDVQNVLKGWDAMKPRDEESTLPGFHTRTRVEYWVIEYTPDQLAAMRDRAQSQLARELIETHRSLLQRIEAADKDLRDAMDALPPSATERDRDALDNRFNARVRSTINDACECFKMCLKGAEVFDETGDLNALFDAVRNAIKTSGMAVNAMLAAKGVKTVGIPREVTTPTPWQVNPSISSGPAPR